MAAPSVRLRVSLKEVMHDKDCSWRSRLEEKAVDARIGPWRGVEFQEMV